MGSERRTTLVDLAGQYPIDAGRMHSECLARAREELRRHDMAAALLCDPLNVRYVTTDDISNVIWNLHSNHRWALVPVDSDPVIWEFSPAVALTKDAWGGDVRPALLWHFFGAGPTASDAATEFAREIATELKQRGILGERIGVDRLQVDGLRALEDAGVRVVDAEMPMEMARAVKTPDEISAMRRSAAVCDAAVAELVQNLRPGVTEIELWAGFMARAHELGAEYSEARLLVSGPRTNPWLQEASSRVIEKGDLVAFDTDLIGPFGYETDISRTYLCGDGAANSEQQRLYSMAHEFIYSALPYFRPGASFEELGVKARAGLPPDFQSGYPVIAHGVGRTFEYPAILWEANHVGELEPNMVVSIEAYINTEDSREGIKLEEQILITDDGYEVFSNAPFDERLTP